MPVCKQCGCAEIETDAARGNSVCTNCGAVLEESAIVSELQFQETGGGGHALVGQYVSSDFGQKTGIGGVRSYGAKESRAITLQNGKRKIQEVASQLRLNQHCVDMAFNFYKMAVTRRLTQGRRWTHVIGSCLYMTCRIENTPHLLLDFSDVVQVNVFELGKTLSFLTRALFITLPPTDPCVYVIRFANKLHFGDKEADVVMVALRLVQRMKRDWMAIGRRPTGVCGAALILAARYYNFNRTVTDIVRVVNVGDTVVRKRLEEFTATPSSALTLNEFLAVDLEQEADPPAFREAKLRARQQQEAADALHEQWAATDGLVERVLAERQAKDRRAPAAAATGLYGRLTSIAPDCADQLCGADAEAAEGCRLVHDELLQQIVSEEGATGKPSTPNYEAFRPTLESLGIKSAPAADGADAPSTSTAEEADDGELELSAIDDAEIESYLLSAPEVELKTRIWMSANGSFVEQMEAKRQRRLEEEERARNDPTKRRRQRQRKKREPIQAATANEAMEMVLQEKKLSNKINYDVLRSLGAGEAAASTSAPADAPPADAPPADAPPSSPPKSPARSPAKPARPPAKRRCFKPLVGKLPPPKPAAATPAD